MAPDGKEVVTILLSIRWLSMLGYFGNFMLLISLIKVTPPAAYYFNPVRRIPEPWYASVTGLRLSWSVFANNRIHYIHALHQRPGGSRHEVGIHEGSLYALLSPVPVGNLFNFRDAGLYSARQKLYTRRFTLRSLRNEWEPKVHEITKLTRGRTKRDALHGEEEMMGWWTLMANELQDIFYSRGKDGCWWKRSRLSRARAGALLLAGSGPTAISLTFLLWCVLSRPAVQKQVEAEVATLEGEVTDVACEQLPILNAVIEESLRLYGTAPGCMPRSPPSGAAMVGGYFIPDDAVVTQYWSLQRNPVICENTDIFDHTRWLRGSGMTEPAKLTFNPFGYGARQCLGIHLGRMTMRLAAAMFFRECRGSRLARSVTESMRIVDSFIVGVPRDRRYSITLQ
ncbi:cytochrome P450 [Aspergillus varians]